MNKHTSAHHSMQRRTRVHADTTQWEVDWNCVTLVAIAIVMQFDPPIRNMLDMHTVLR